MSEKCSMPKCDSPAAGLFRETALCSKHLEIAETWEWLFGGPVRLPTVAELKRARGSRKFADYALNHFLQMNVRYGAIDVEDDWGTYNSLLLACLKTLKREITRRQLNIWLFRRGGTVYLVRDDLKVRNSEG